MNLALQTSCHHSVALEMLVHLLFGNAIKINDLLLRGPRKGKAHATSLALPYARPNQYTSIRCRLQCCIGGRDVARGRPQCGLLQPRSETISNSALLDLGRGGTYLPIPLTLRLDPKHFTLNFAGSRNGLFAILTKLGTIMIQNKLKHPEKEFLKLK
jgi:hypothetical protein